MLNYRTIKLGVICPMANEIDTAELFINDILVECKKFNFKSIKLFVVIDNVSTDGTRDILEDLAKELSELNVIFAPENRNVVDAYLRGYKEALNAGSDWILEIDAGYSHQPHDILKFFETMRKGYDCVFGSRFCHGGMIIESSKKRYIISKCGTIITNFLLGTKLTDMTSGFELFTRKALNMIFRNGIVSKGPFFQTEIKFYAHTLKIAEIPIHYRMASHDIGISALSDAMMNLCRLFFLRLINKLTI